MITNFTATPPRFFSELKGKTWRIVEFDLIKSNFIPNCYEDSKDKLITFKNITNKKKIKKWGKNIEGTFTAQERIAFSVGDPDTSISPPSYQRKYIHRI